MGENSKIQKSVVDDVLNRVEEYKAVGGLHLPGDYSVQNAIQAAGLIIAKTVDKNKKPALEVCTRESVANALLYMVTNGLNPLKEQCYFVVYGNELQCSKSYQGSIALAKRFGGVVEVVAQAVFTEDDFAFRVDHETGRKEIIKHGQTLASLNSGVVGAYATAFLADGTKDVEIMTIEQIKQAWLMRNKGDKESLTKAHENFSDEMAKKTVINRLCKPYINTSNDSVILPENYNKQLEDGNSKKPNAKILAEQTTEVKQIPNKIIGPQPKEGPGPKEKDSNEEGKPGF